MYSILGHRAGLYGWEYWRRAAEYDTSGTTLRGHYDRVVEMSDRFDPPGLDVCLVMDGFYRIHKDFKDLNANDWSEV